MSGIKIKESVALTEVKAIRQELYEETKTLTPEAYCEKINREGEALLSRYNLKLKRLSKQSATA